MARIEDIPEPTRGAVLGLDIRPLATAAFVAGPPLAQRRVALVSSAALHRRDEAPLLPGTAEFRSLDADLEPGDVLMSHVSINFDRAGWQHDRNTVYPLDRLRELASEGVVGKAAQTHYSVMGSTDPATMDATAAGIAAAMRAEKVDAALFCPV